MGKRGEVFSRFLWYTVNVEFCEGLPRRGGPFVMVGRQEVTPLARPLKYKTAAQLQQAIDAYFEECAGTPLLDGEGKAVTDKYGAPVIVDAHPPTVTGLALALGFTGRKQLLDYQGRKAFCNTITRAKARCEEYAERRLYDRDGARGAQFSLEHNFRWLEQSRAAEEQPPEDPLSRALREYAEGQYGNQ